jgi:hypothetical protein
MAELTVEADIDAYMMGAPPELKDVNFGDVTTIRLGISYDGGVKSFWYRPIGNFDVSALAEASLNSAKLVREMSFATSGGVASKLSRCTRPAAWTEDGVTWNKYDGTNDWTAGGGDFDDTGPPAVIDYTEPSGAGTHELAGLLGFVQDALDNRNGIVSIIIRLADESPGVSQRFDWRSKEYGSDIWRLVIDYTPPAVPNPGRRGIGPSPLARGAPDLRPVRAARPTRAASGAGPARPRRQRRTA